MLWALLWCFRWMFEKKKTFITVFLLMTCKKIFPSCNQLREFPFSWDGTPTYLFRAALNNAQEVHLFSSLWAGPKITFSIFSHLFFFLCDADANDACFGTAGSDVCACNPGYSGNPCSGRLIQILTLRFVTSYCICVMNRIRASSSSLSSFYLIKHVNRRTHVFWRWFFRETD